MLLVKGQTIFTCELLPFYLESMAKSHTCKQMEEHVVRYNNSRVLVLVKAVYFLLTVAVLSCHITFFFLLPSVSKSESLLPKYRTITAYQRMSCLFSPLCVPLPAK